MLSDRCLSVLSLLSVTLGYCGQTVEWIKMPLGTQIAVSSKYDTELCNLSECVIKQNIWSAFADTVIFSM